MRLSWSHLAVIILWVGPMVFSFNAWGADWKEFAEATSGIFQYDSASVSSPSEGIFRVWIHNVTQHETSLVELNCRTRSYRVLDLVEYDESGRMKNRHDYYDNPNWLTISPKSVPEPLSVIVCP